MLLMKIDSYRKMMAAYKNLSPYQAMGLKLSFIALLGVIGLALSLGSGNSIVRDGVTKNVSNDAIYHSRVVQEKDNILVKDFFIPGSPGLSLSWIKKDSENGSCNLYDTATKQIYGTSTKKKWLNFDIVKPNLRLTYYSNHTINRDKTFDTLNQCWPINL
jgi:hypothetical protein